MRKNDVPDLDRLFKMLSAGKMPTFSEMMSAIEDIGAYVQSADESSLLSTGAQKRDDPPYLCPQDEEKCPSCGL